MGESWQLMLVKCKGEPPLYDEDADDSAWDSLGSADTVREALSTALPGIRWTKTPSMYEQGKSLGLSPPEEAPDSYWDVFERPIWEGTYVDEGVTVNVHGQDLYDEKDWQRLLVDFSLADQVLSAFRTVCRENGWSAFDLSVTNRLIDWSQERCLPWLSFSEWKDQFAADAGLTLDSVLDRALTRNPIESEAVDLLRGFDPHALLKSLRDRVETSDRFPIRTNAYVICAQVLGKIAESWIREIVDQPIINLHVLDLFPDIANCIGPEEGFEIAVGKLKNEHPDQLALTAHALLHFGLPDQLLAWIESQLVRSQGPVTKDWGQLAALAGISWTRITNWLKVGSPLSLVALDAMNCCRDYDAGVGGWLHTHRPRLVQPATPQNMRAVLEEFAQTNPTPRIVSSVETLVTNIEDF